MSTSKTENIDDAAKALSALGASKGGQARARSLTKEQLSEIGRKGSAARWKKAGKDIEEIIQATHGSPDRPLKIGDIEIPCYVLADGKRVIVRRGMISGLAMATGTARTMSTSLEKSADRLTKFIESKSLKPSISDDLAAKIRTPIRFKTTNGVIAFGCEATVLADLCDAVLDARKKGDLHRQQVHIAERCEILVRGFARVGITALIDEATGYQDDRARDALAKILEAFVAKELQKWVRTFPSEFYKELFRLQNWPYTGKTQRPALVGRLTNDLVYSRLAPGVLEELRRVNPPDEKGRRKHKHFQHLTPDLGHPKLVEHLVVVTALLKASTTWDQFKDLINRAKPKQTKLPLFDEPDN
jgi:hypothetical protein